MVETFLCPLGNDWASGKTGAPSLRIFTKKIACLFAEWRLVLDDGGRFSTLREARPRGSGMDVERTFRRDGGACLAPDRGAGRRHRRGSRANELRAAEC